MDRKVIASPIAIAIEELATDETRCTRCGNLSSYNFPYMDCGWCGGEVVWRYELMRRERLPRERLNKVESLLYFKTWVDDGKYY